MTLLCAVHELGHSFLTNQHYLFEGIADPVVDPNDSPGNGWQAPPEEEVCRKHGDEREVLLAAEAHDGERCLDTPSHILVLRTLHPAYLVCMLCQGAQQLVMLAAALCHAASHSCGHLR